MKAGFKLRLIAISYAKHALEVGSREHLRLLSYARAMGEYHVIVFTRKYEGFLDYQQVENLHLYATNARTRIGMLWRAYKIGRQILQDRGGEGWVVSSQDPFEASVVGSAVAFGNRATHHIQIHGDVFNPLSYQTSLLGRVRVAYGRRAVRHANCLRVVSNRIKRSLRLLTVAEEKITVLPIYSDIAPFLAVGEKRTHVVSNNVAFLYVGRFAPEKNIPLIINSFAALAHGYQGATLTLMGDGPLKANLQTLIKQRQLSERIKIVGWSQNVAAVMAVHDVLCLASYHEGWGMVLVEAAAAGMPVVTTDVGCAGECVRQGETGQIVLVGDDKKYAAAMESYLRDTSLVAAEGTRGYALMKAQVPSEHDYIQQLVESYTSCL